MEEDVWGPRFFDVEVFETQKTLTAFPKETEGHLAFLNVFFYFLLAFGKRKREQVPFFLRAF